ncbi:MAG: dethiobiotin synthase [Bacteroidia bacterium]
MRKIFVTGIGTDVGKTVVSAVLVEALQADYWKPIQTGSFYGTDTDKVQKLIGNDKSKFHSERFLLEKYMSPHAAAELEGVQIKLEDFELPPTSNETLIIEGVGGIMVPLNKEHFVLDIIKKIDCEVLLVVQNYLGSINHSILSLEVLRHHNINVIGTVFNGPKHQLSEEIILHHSSFKFVGHINKEVQITPEIISRYAEQFKSI